MRKATFAVLILVCSAAWAKPRLLLWITVDSLGADALHSVRPKLKGGLSQLLRQGAWFSEARYEYAETTTAAGHTTLATGANPWRHGVVSNRIVSRGSGKMEGIFSDPSHPTLEAPLADFEDSSPERLLAETVADRLRIATFQKGKVISIAGKARGAIPLAGKLGQAYWFSDAVGKFVTGTYYAKEHPAWLKAWNDKRLADSLFGKEWSLLLSPSQYLGEDFRPFEEEPFSFGKVFPRKVTGGAPSPGAEYYRALAASPFMGEQLVQLAKAAVAGESLGKDDAPDILAISFSHLDLIYHSYGPYSWEYQDSILQLDRALGDLLSFLERTIGKQQLLVALSADHGGAALPEEWAALGLPSGRVDTAALAQGLNKELSAGFGSSDLVLGIEGLDVYLNARAIAERKLDGAAIRKKAIEWLSARPGVAFALSRDELADPNAAQGYSAAFRAGFYAGRSGDVFWMPRPYWVASTAGTTHGTPYAYDAQVPLVIAGPGVAAGRRLESASPAQLAPTLSALLDIGRPAQSEAAVLPLTLVRQ